MPKSTRARVSGRTDVIEMFSPRRSGPWRALRPLHTKWGLVTLAVLTLAGIVYFHAQHLDVLAWAVPIVAGLLLVLSFKFLWELIGLLIRSRAELTTAGLVVADGEWLRSFLSAAWADAIPLLLAGVVLAVPVTRRFVVGRFFAVLDRHRLRACLRQTKVRTMNMDGSLPLLLWARPTKTGERVWVWARAGAAGEDIESAVSYIASACYARDARVDTNRRLATLITIDIIRRDPLSSSTITSLLGKYLPNLGGTLVTTEGTDSLAAISVAEITNTAVNPEDIVRTSGKAKATKKAATITPTVVPAPKPDGEDYSDFID